MDTNLVLVWIVALNGVVGLAKLARHDATLTRGWRAIYVALLVLLAGLWFLVPERAGLIALPVWAVIVALPAFGMVALVKLIHAGSFGSAAIVARAIAVLHPMDGWGQYPDYVRLYRSLHTGDLEEARTLIARLRRVTTPLSRAAEVMSLGITGDWAEFRAWVEGSPDPTALLRDAGLLNGYLNALGRLGEHDAMLEAYERYGLPLLRRAGTAHGAAVRLAVAGQAGSLSVMQRLVDGPLASFPPAARAYHMGVAEQVAGQVDRAEAHFRQVLADEYAGASMRARSQKQIDEPLPPLDRSSLSARSRELLDELEHETGHESRYAFSSAKRTRPIATYVLAALLLVVYAFELPGGSSDIQNLIDLGALVVPAPDGAPWWTPISAGFLHFGHLHVVLNLFGLLMLGTWVERAFGTARMLACYAIALVASTGLFPYFVQITPEAPVHMLVGASGGVLGLLGVLLARTLVGRLRGQSLAVRRQLTWLVMLVGLQVVFDQSVPQVSSLCHALGMTTGFIVGLVFAARE